MIATGVTDAHTSRINRESRKKPGAFWEFSVTRMPEESGGIIFFRLFNRNVCKLEVLYYFWRESKQLQLWKQQI